MRTSYLVCKFNDTTRFKDSISSSLSSVTLAFMANFSLSLSLQLETYAVAGPYVAVCNLPPFDERHGKTWIVKCLRFSLPNKYLT